VPNIHFPGGKFTEKFGDPDRTIQETIHLKMMPEEITTALDELLSNMSPQLYT
jgi:hypothetical protein